MRIKDLDESLRPREKAKRYGIEALDTSELIALIIGSGVKGSSAIDIGRTLLMKYDLSSFFKLDYCALKSERGFKDPTIFRLLGAIELCKRINKTNKSITTKIDSINQVLDIYTNELSILDYEVIILVMLNNQNRIIKEEVLSKGSSIDTSFSPVDLFRCLLKEGTRKFYLLHNHPSGNKNPSTNDIYYTLELIKLCNNVGIKLIDHIIISQYNYFSFKENNLM